MKKLFILKETGQPVKMGELFTYHYATVKEDDTVIEGKVTTTLTEEKIPKLLKRGILTIQIFGKPEEFHTVPSNVNYYVNKLMNKLSDKSFSSFEIKAIQKFVNNIIENYPAAFLNMLLREVAIELDKKYEGVINHCEEFWVISTLNGKICKVPREPIKNFRNFAAFRTDADALFAKKVTKDFYDLCFNGRKQEDKECNCLCD